MDEGQQAHSQYTKDRVYSHIIQLREIEETCCIHIQDECIYRSTYTKSLGFYIDQYFDWDDHINHLIKKASAGMAILGTTGDNLEVLPLSSLRFLWRGAFNKTSKSAKQGGAYCDQI